MQFIIKPLVGIYWDTNSILLGDDIDTVTKVCEVNYKKSIKPQGTVLYLFNASLQIFFNDKNKAEFIMFGGGYNTQLDVSIYGINPFKTPAKQLVSLLKKENNNVFTDDDNGYSYEFCHISVSLWRESTPDDLAEITEDINSDSHLSKQEKENFIATEFLKSNYFETIGIAVKNYYS